MQWLLVGLSTGAALASWLFMGIARQEAKRAHNAFLRLASQRAIVVGLEGAVDALQTNLRRLNGKVAHLGTPVPDPAGVLDERPHGAIRQTGAPFDVCENWLTACRDGPLSEAARCECEYCVDARARRARLRSELLPARGPEAHAEQVREHKARA